MSKKILIPSLVVVIIALIGVISFLIYKQNSTPNNLKTDQNQTVIVPTATVLITYKNPQFPNFSFDYPSTYKVEFKDYTTITAANLTPYSIIEVFNSSNQQIFNIPFYYEFGGGGVSCWGSKTDNPKQYIEDASKKWYLITSEQSGSSLYWYILKSDFHLKGSAKFNEDIALYNSEVQSNNEPKLDLNKVIGCERSHGSNYTKTTFKFEPPVLGETDLSTFSISSNTKPTITKEISDILDSIKGLEDQSSSVSTPAPTNTTTPSNSATNTPVPTNQTTTPLTSNDLVDTKCDKYKAKVGDKIVCLLNFSKVVSSNQVSTIKFALASPAGSPTDLSSMLATCNMPSTTDSKSINCTFDTKTIKPGSYSTSIEINNDLQLGVTDNITITK